MTWLSKILESLSRLSICPIPRNGVTVAPALIRAGGLGVGEIGMASVLTVANKILEIAKAEGKPITPLQLMKLTYIAHGWMLGITGKPLFGDRIEAWKYGPVIPVLYHRTKEFGSHAITDQLPAPTGDALDTDADGLLESVVSSYGGLSGAALSNLTHQPKSPWSQVWEDGRSHIEIPREIIRAHYEKLKGKDVVDAA